MDRDDLHVFITIAREKSITKAAHVLHMTQPGLTMKLKKLEFELGVRLLERNWKGVNLTRQGTLFLNHAITIMQEMDLSMSLLKSFFQDSAESRAADAPEDKLIIGISRPLGFSFIAPILSELKRSYPSLKLDIISEMPSHILDLLAVGEIHLGILSYEGDWPNIQSLPIYKDEMLLLGPNHDPVPLRDDLQNMELLLQKRFILFNSRAHVRRLTNQLLVQLLGAMPEDIQEVTDLGLVLSMVANGLGYTIMPTSFIMDSANLLSPYTADVSPKRFVHETMPYQIFRLGPHLPTRNVHMVYSTLHQQPRSIHDIAEKISCHYRSKSEVV